MRHRAFPRKATAKRHDRYRSTAKEIKKTTSKTAPARKSNRDKKGYRAEAKCKSRPTPKDGKNRKNVKSTHKDAAPTKHTPNQAIRPLLRHHSRHQQCNIRYRDRVRFGRQRTPFKPFIFVNYNLHSVTKSPIRVAFLLQSSYRSHNQTTHKKQHFASPDPVAAKARKKHTRHTPNDKKRPRKSGGAWLLFYGDGCQKPISEYINPCDSVILAFISVRKAS